MDRVAAQALSTGGFIVDHGPLWPRPVPRRRVPSMVRRRPPAGLHRQQSTRKPPRGLPRRRRRHTGTDSIFARVVGPGGFEPPAHGLRVRCSTRLSYEPIENFRCVDTSCHAESSADRPLQGRHTQLSTGLHSIAPSARERPVRPVPAPRRASGALHVQLVRLGRVLHDELEPGRAVAPHQFGDRLLRHHPLGVGNADFKQATPLGRKGRFV